jgi:hypothetical protein
MVPALSNNQMVFHCLAPSKPKPLIPRPTSFYLTACRLQDRVQTLQTTLALTQTPSLKDKRAAFFKNAVLSMCLAGTILLKRHHFTLPLFIQRILISWIECALPKTQLHEKLSAAHSLCHFAGRNIDHLALALIQRNNAYWQEEFQENWEMTEEEALQETKDHDLYIEPSVEALQAHGGIEDVILLSYIRLNKNVLNLPEECTIHWTAGELDSRPIQESLQAIARNPVLHRVIIICGHHYVALRKDPMGQWRIIDSATSMQPTCETLQEAIHNVLHNHGAAELGLIYPSADNR